MFSLTKLILGRLGLIRKYPTPIVNIDARVPTNAADNAQFINLVNIQIKQLCF